MLIYLVYSYARFVLIFCNCYDTGHISLQVGAQSAHVTRATVSPFSLQVLENAKKVITARTTPGRNPMTQVERELNPHLRKALRIVVDPTAFLEGGGNSYLAGSF